MSELLGKITSVRLGKGGYDDAAFGLSITIETPDGGFGDFFGFWDVWMKPSEGSAWSEKTRIERYGETMLKIATLCNEAKASDMMQLQGKPVAVIQSDFKMVSWRILTEVL